MKRKIKINIYIDESKDPVSFVDETDQTKEECIKNVNEMFNSNNIINIFLEKKIIALRPSQLKLIMIEEINKKEEEYLEEE